MQKEHSVSSFQDLGGFSFTITLSQKPKGATRILSDLLLKFNTTCASLLWASASGLFIYEFRYKLTQIKKEEGLTAEYSNQQLLNHLNRFEEVNKQYGC